jgi:hypothetical protein
MLINKDPDQAHEVNLLVRKGSTANAFVAPIDVVQFSAAQYQLSSDRENPVPTKSNPPVHFTLARSAVLSLPAYSLTIVRARLQ